jgi:hypothetical protein
LLIYIAVKIWELCLIGEGTEEISTGGATEITKNAVKTQMPKG